MVPKLSYIKCYDNKLLNTFVPKPFLLKIENGPPNVKLKKAVIFTEVESFDKESLISQW